MNFLFSVSKTMAQITDTNENFSRKRDGFGGILPRILKKENRRFIFLEDFCKTLRLSRRRNHEEATKTTVELSEGIVDDFLDLSVVLSRGLKRVFERELFCIFGSKVLHIQKESFRCSRLKVLPRYQNILRFECQFKNFVDMIETFAVEGFFLCGCLFKRKRFIQNYTAIGRQVVKEAASRRKKGGNELFVSFEVAELQELVCFFGKFLMIELTGH